MVPFEEKRLLVLQHNEKGVPLRVLGAITGLPCRSIRNWADYATEHGMPAFEEKYAPLKYSMGRPRKKTFDEMSEVEQLRYRVKYLEAENALLKKVQALVEEREARLKGTGPKPSKN